MKFYLRMIIRLVIFLPFGMLYSLIKRDPSRATILMYHRVDDHLNKELAVRRGDFQWQMNYLKRKKYNVITMDSLLEKIQTKTVNNKCVVLTFDDGYEDYFKTSYPTLKKYRFPSIQYVVTDYIGSYKTFWWDRDIGTSKLMNWDQLIELNQCDLVEFGAHTVTHRDLDRITTDDIKKELIKCKEILEKKLGKEIKHFCYPRGKYDDNSRNLVKDIYKTGVLIYEGFPSNKRLGESQRCMLKRAPVQRSDGRLLFIARIKGWLVLEEKLRTLLQLIKNIAKKTSH
jgi:peptidoglycan/xylan/chitin deacetylase (PgdA/CDA1 family)